MKTEIDGRHWNNAAPNALTKWRKLTDAAKMEFCSCGINAGEMTAKNNGCRRYLKSLNEDLIKYKKEGRVYFFFYFQKVRNFYFHIGPNQEYLAGS